MYPCFKAVKKERGQVPQLAGIGTIFSGVTVEGNVHIILRSAYQFDTNCAMWFYKILTKGSNPDEITRVIVSDFLNMIS